MAIAVAQVKNVDRSATALLFKITGSVGASFQFKHGLGRTPAYVQAWAEGTAGDICTVTAKDGTTITVTITSGSTGYVLASPVFG